MGFFSNDNPTIENADLDCSPQNEYVFLETVAKIDDILRPGEQVHYLARTAGGGIDVQRGDEEDNKQASGGFIRTAATDRRIVAKVPNLIGHEEISVPYSSITAVNYKSAALRKRLQVQSSSKTYGFGVGNEDKKVAREMADFVREKVAEENNQQESSTDPMDKIEKLRELKKSGAITEEEFEEKKQKLLDQI